MLLNRQELELFRGIDVDIFPLTAIIANGDSKATPVDVMQFKEITLFIHCSAIAGTTKQLDVKVMTKDPASDHWYQLAAFTQLTAVGGEMKAVAANLGSQIAIEYTKHDDTTGATFSVSGTAKIM
jgi:hypothetical protein